MTLKLHEAVTPGLSRALSKLSTKDVCACGFPMPKYPGRYPLNCPSCGKPRGQGEELPEPHPPRADEEE